MHVVIVGAGIIGLSTAFELQTRGIQVTIFDSTPAQGASHAAAGMLAPAAETAWGDDLLHGLLGASNAHYPQLIDRIESVTGRCPDYLQNSTLVIAVEPADREALHELVELQQSLGYRAEQLLPSAARRLEPSLATSFAGAVRCVDDHQIDPRSLTGILKDHLEAHIVPQKVLRLLKREGKTYAVQTTTGKIIEADQVVLASGLGRVEGGPQVSVRPVYGDILRLQGPLGPPLISHTLRAIVHREPVYLVPRKDGSLVLGASSREDGNANVNVGQMHKLLDHARRIVPGIADCSLQEVIARGRPTTADGRPALGRIDEGLILSTGYSRHGVLLTPFAARLAADLIQDPAYHSPYADALNPQRFSDLSHSTAQLAQNR